jgi:hypothetical protein
MKLNSKRIYERKNNEMQEQKKNRLSAYRERIFEIMDSLEEITDELDELQEEMEDDIIDPADLIPPLFPPLDENGNEIGEDDDPQVNVTVCVFPEGKNFTLPIEMIRRMLDEH